MTLQVLAVAVVVALSSTGAAQPQASTAAQIVADYLRIPYPTADRLDEGRAQRLDTLSRLQATPDAAADAIAQALPQVKDPRRRADLAEALGRYALNPKSAALLAKLLKDPDEKVRGEAIQGLRVLARRTERMGGQRVPRSGAQPKDEQVQPLAEYAPKVEGLVPYLVAAANDAVESNRISALYALADARDPQAAAELRRRLKDPSESVRFYAACLLTEYQDASGLPEMRAALARLQQPDSQADPLDDFPHYSQAEQLLASFERITGKSFGPIPLNPVYSSDTRQIPDLKQSYRTLLATWAQWWAWEPSGHP